MFVCSVYVVHKNVLRFKLYVWLCLTAKDTALISGYTAIFICRGDLGAFANLQEKQAAITGSRIVFNLH
jgi:hypothetical protein